MSEEKLQKWALEAIDAMGKPSSAREVTLWLMHEGLVSSTIGLENRAYSLLRRMEDRGMVVSDGWRGRPKADFIFCRKFSRGTILDQLCKDL